MCIRNVLSLKSDAPDSPRDPGPKVPRETRSEDMKGSWGNGHQGSLPRLVVTLKNCHYHPHLGWIQPWFPAVPGSLPLARFLSLLTSLKPASQAVSSRHYWYRCLQEMNLANRAGCRVPGAGRISRHSNDSPYACAMPSITRQLG